MKLINNELHPELLGNLSINPFVGQTSSPRGQMFMSHAAQMLAIENPTPRQTQTGLEMEFGKYTFNIRMPADGKILRVLDRYRQGVDGQYNPEQVVIYQDQDTNEIGMVSLVRHDTHNGYFGYTYKPGAQASQLRVGEFIPKDSVLMEVAAVNDQGDFMYGREVPVAFMTVPQVTDDALWVSESFLENMKYRTYEKAQISWGGDRFPLCIDEKAGYYKIFPDIGEVIGHDALVMVLRQRESGNSRDEEPDMLAPVSLHKQACRTVDYACDRKYYIGVPGKSRVVDVEIYHDGAKWQETPMDEQPLRYLRASRAFAQEVVSMYNEYTRRHSGHAKWSAPLHRLINTSLAMLAPDKGPERVQKVYKQNKISTWELRITVETIHTPGMGSKFTDCHGGKGVVSKISPDADMPTTAQGVRAHLVSDPVGTFNRMNIGRLYESYINASANVAHRRICQLVGIEPGTRKERAAMGLLGKTDQVNQAFAMWVDFHGTVNPLIPLWVNQGKIGQDKVDFIAHLIEHGITVYYPTDNQHAPADIVRELNAHANAPELGPVTYRQANGEMVTTKGNIRVGPLYVIMLNKTGTDANAASVTRIHSYGTPAVITGNDAFQLPIRSQGSRGFGEAEFRGLASYAQDDRTSELVAEILDRNTSPDTLRHMIETILNAPEPGNIDDLVDRSVMGYTPRPLQIVQHMLSCAGLRFNYEPYQAK